MDHVDLFHCPTAFDDGDSALQIELLRDVLRVSGLRNKGQPGVVPRRAKRAEHHAVMHRLRGGDRGVDIAHWRAGDHPALDDRRRFYAKKGGRPQHQIGQFARLNGADFMGDTVG